MLLELSKIWHNFINLIIEASDLIIFRSLSAVYSVLVLFFSLAVFDSQQYGELSIALVQYALFARIVAYGFDYVAIDIVKSSEFSYENILICKFILYMFFIVICVIFCASPFLIVALISGLFFCFDLTPFYQARHSLHGLSRLAAAVYFFASLCGFFAYYFEFASSILFFSLITIPPNLIWVVHFFRRKNRSADINFAYCLSLLRRCLPMSFVAQVPGAYTNLIPLIIGVASVELAGLYYFLFRISNLGKMIGIILNQTLFYGVRPSTQKLILMIVNSAGVFILVYAGALAATLLFEDKFSIIMGSLEYIIFLLALLTANSIIASYFIAERFLRRWLHRSYLIFACSIISLCMLTFWLAGVYSLQVGFITHLAIESCLLIAAIFYRPRDVK